MSISGRTGFLELDIEQMEQLAREAGDILLHTYKELQPANADDGITPEKLLGSLEQFFKITKSIDAHIDRAADADVDQNMQNLGDHGLRLLNELKEYCTKLNCFDEEAIFEGLSIPVSLWAAAHQLKLSELDTVVDALSHIANQTHDTQELSILVDMMEMIINAVSPQIRQDLDKSNPGRPWRILNINHSIVATRTHDTKIMEAVFEQLTFRLPEEAAGFFAEGMEQMDIVGYPDHVRRVMEHYYHKTHNPTLH